jgi:hypothetical protein
MKKNFWEVQGLMHFPDADLAKFAAIAGINPPGNYEGPAIASAAAITISHPVHKVSGAAAVATINPPYPGFVGRILLVPTGAFTTVATGNIAIARQAVVGVPIDLYYDGSTWYPSSAA